MALKVQAARACSQRSECMGDKARQNVSCLEHLEDTAAGSLRTSQVAQWKRTSLAGQEMQCQPLDGEDALEEEMVTHSRILA